MHSVIGRDPTTHRLIELQLEGEFISAINEVRSDIQHWIAPGLVDLQVNGYRGIDLNSDDVNVKSIWYLTRKLAASGTTTYLPTIITASQTAMAARLRTVAAARSAYPEVWRAVPAIHIEGPWISPREGYRGAHPVSAVRAPSIQEFEELQTAASGLIRIVTLSPHWPQSNRFIRTLTQQGVLVSLGHTDASPEQIHAAVDAGATLATHLGNGIAADLARHPNPIWTLLADDRLTASFIADGFHLPADTLRAMLRSKTVARAILVSDSVALAGAAPGEHRSHIGGTVLIHADGSIRMRHSGLLAGSGIALKDAVARAPSLTGCTLAEALRMGTQNPAAALEIPRGSIEIGSCADLILFRWNEKHCTIDIVDVIVRGVSIHSQEHRQKEIH